MYSKIHALFVNNMKNVENEYKKKQTNERMNDVYCICIRIIIKSKQTNRYNHLLLIPSNSRFWFNSDRCIGSSADKIPRFFRILYVVPVEYPLLTFWLSSFSIS